MMSVQSDSILFGSRSPTPLQTIMWIPQGMWFGGLFVFSVTAVALFVHLVVLQIRDPERGFRLYGPPTVEEEVEREMAQAQARTAEAQGRGATEPGGPS